MPDFELSRAINALDASGTGGRIILREHTAVHPKTGERGVNITVADNGRGMSVEVKAHLFEAFTSTKGLRGTGLGCESAKESSQGIPVFSRALFHRAGGQEHRVPDIHSARSQSSARKSYAFSPCAYRV
jgi:phosphoglycerate-specific signal transduction histidine kinase